MSTVSSLLPVSPALDQIGTLRHLLKAYKSSASSIFCQILFHFLEQLHGPQNMRNLTNVYFGERTFTYSFPGSAAGAAALNPARGPLAVALPYGSSLLSVGERGRRPSRRHLCPPKTPAFYGVLCSSHFFPFFGSCGLRWVNMGQDRPQDGPT